MTTIPTYGTDRLPAPLRAPLPARLPIRAADLLYLLAAACAVAVGGTVQVLAAALFVAVVAGRVAVRRRAVLRPAPGLPIDR